MDDAEQQVREAAGEKTPQFMNAAEYLKKEPEPSDPIFEGVFDRGDKVVIISTSKGRKTFYLDQMCLCLSAGIPFLRWRCPKHRRVVLIQFEIRPHHKHRRIRKLAGALRIKPESLGDRFHILNARGLGIQGTEGLEKITPALLDFQPDVICIDPLYKLTTGVENAAEDAKIMLNAFDVLAEKTGAAILFVHHDPKGSPGDRDIRDRGAGSNVLGRDYDACFALTSHATEEDAIVVETLLRNYRPQDPIVIEWAEDERGNYCFIERADMIPQKKTSRTKPAKPPLTTYLPYALSILNGDEMEIAPFKAAFKSLTALGDNRIKDFMSWATAGGNPPLVTREERRKGHYQKWVRANC